MNIFFPIFCFIAAGIIDYFYKLNEKLIGRILLYVAVPIVIFYAVYTVDWIEFAMYASFAFITSLALVFVAPIMAPKASKQYGKSIVGCSFGYLNIGWFGIPISATIYGMEGASVAAALYFGGMIFGNTIGYYLLAKNQLGIKQAVKKLLLMPVFYMLFLGALFNFFDISLPIVINDIAFFTKVIVTILGMGLAGIGLARALKCKHAWAGTFDLVARRFAALLIVNTIFILLFGSILGFSEFDWKVLTLIYILPIAANVVIFATELNHDIQKVAAIVGASTLVSVLLIPIYLFLYKYLLQSI